MSDVLERTVERTAERLATRFYGKYRGLVSDIGDPENMCRIKATVPAVLNDQVSPWAMPALPFAGDGHGFVMLPRVGSGVWIEFEGGDISRPIWSGGFFASGQRPSPDGERDRVIVSDSGHQIILDDEGGEIKIVHSGGAQMTMSATEIVLSLGACELKISPTEISLNQGMVKVTVAGVSLVNDAMKLGV